MISENLDHPQGNVPEKATQKESHLRSVIKSVSWRVVGSIDTMLLSYLFTSSVKIAALIGSTEVITKIILYYLHERAWQIIPRNTVRHWFKSRKN